MTVVGASRPDAKVEFRAVRGEDLDRLAALSTEAFRTAPDPSTWCADGRVMAEAGRIHAALCAHRFGQFFGGRSVAASGLAWVAVAPEWRGRGAGRRLVKATLTELRHSGAALSTLYPSTARFYRVLGFETAGMRTGYTADVGALGSSTAAPVEPWEDVDLDGVAGCYASVARHTNGLIDRPPLWWLSNLLVPTDNNPVYRYLVRRADGAVGGYVIYRQQPLQGPRVDYSIACRELVWTDSESLVSLMRFIGCQSAFGRTLHWWGPVDEPLLAWLEYPRVESDRSEPWMARVLDVPGALEQRGYAGTVEGSLELQVIDELFPENSRPIRLDVASGRGCVSVGRRPSAALDIGALSALYTGWLRATDLARFGRLHTDSDRVLDLLDLIFAGPKPWMSERF